ncbi:CBS domain-containing protein [Streptomyces sp. Da 82-17]|uniref:CBS domain-containing protein n=1 Tax=Streptomyces sp. Da 82-17 TaxID=3377116 RepID=UPI0038D43673
MNDFERFSAGAEARRAAPGRTPRPDEERREDLLTRYIGAVASVSAKHAAVRLSAAVQNAEKAETPEKTPARTTQAGNSTDTHTEPPLVREVMDVPAASVREDTPFLEVARMLTREDVGSLPVVDAEDHVLGVVSESDLLAKAAVEASGHHPGVLARLRERRLHDKARGETAETLMTSPAITVYPRQTVAEAAWLVALSRLKRLPVTDHSGRLVGVVHRNALLNALIRDETQTGE